MIETFFDMFVFFVFWGSFDSFWAKRPFLTAIGLLHMQGGGPWRSVLIGLPLLAATFSWTQQRQLGPLGVAPGYGLGPFAAPQKLPTVEVFQVFQP